MSEDATRVWGDNETQFFYALTPDKILNSVEQSGISCTGRCLQLNSMENRVYEVEIDLEERPKDPSEAFKIVKFYRPGRWSREQILEEHQFLLDLAELEIPVVCPERFSDGKTLHQLDEVDICYAVFPKVGGRSPDELDDEQFLQIGRLIARMHAVGGTKTAEHRLQLTPETYGRQNLDYLLRAEVLPEVIENRYEDVVHQICDIGDELYDGVRMQRVHGDGHLGNLLWGRQGAFWVDFDDMVTAPCVQDLWLLIPGRGPDANAAREILLEGYEQMKPFDRRELALIEVLRALRFVHFAAWISMRWEDPSFPQAFPLYGTDRYWFDQLQDLDEQLALLQPENSHY